MKEILDTTERSNVEIKQAGNMQQSKRKTVIYADSKACNLRTALLSKLPDWVLEMSDPNTTTQINALQVIFKTQQAKVRNRKLIIVFRAVVPLSSTSHYSPVMLNTNNLQSAVKQSMMKLRSLNVNSRFQVQVAPSVDGIIQPTNSLVDNYEKT